MQLRPSIATDIIVTETAPWEPFMILATENWSYSIIRVLRLGSRLFANL